MKNFLRVSYSLLFLFLVICLVIYFTNPFGTQWSKDFTLNLTAEIIGILLVVFLIDRVININQERERKRRQAIAFQQLRIPLLHHFHLLFHIFKSSTETRPDKDYKDVVGLFDDRYFIEIAFFDFSKEAPVVPPTDWFNRLSRECQRFKEALNNTMEKYSLYLESDTIDLMEEIINSHFISFILQAPVIPKIDKEKGFKRQYNLFSGQGMCDLVKEYTVLFSRLVDSYNQNVLHEKRIEMTDDLWRNDVAPRIGSGRIS